MNRKHSFQPSNHDHRPNLSSNSPDDGSPFTNSSGDEDTPIEGDDTSVLGTWDSNPTNLANDEFGINFNGLFDDWVSPDFDQSDSDDTQSFLESDSPSTDETMSEPELRSPKSDSNSSSQGSELNVQQISDSTFSQPQLTAYPSFNAYPTTSFNQQFFGSLFPQNFVIGPFNPVYQTNNCCSNWGFIAPSFAANNYVSPGLSRFIGFLQYKIKGDRNVRFKKELLHSLYEIFQKKFDLEPLHRKDKRNKMKVFEKLYQIKDQVVYLINNYPSIYLDPIFLPQIRTNSP